MKTGHWQGESVEFIKMLRPTEQFCTMLAGHQYNEQQIPAVQQSRLSTDSSSDQKI
jgi:hypothetical protein